MGTKVNSRIDNFYYFLYTCIRCHHTYISLQVAVTVALLLFTLYFVSILENVRNRTRYNSSHTYKTMMAIVLGYNAALCRPYYNTSIACICEYYYYFIGTTYLSRP